MKKLNDNLRYDYEAFRSLLFNAEHELGEIPVSALYETRSVLDHIMRASEGLNEESELQKARNHLMRGCKDIYLLLLSSRLDRLRMLPMYLAGDELERFKAEYNKIKEMVEYIKTDSNHHKSPSDYYKSLSDIDTLIDSFYLIESEVLLKNKFRIDRYKSILIAIFSGLVGVSIKFIIDLLTK